MFGIGITRAGANPGQTIRLEIQYLDQGDKPIDPSTFPEIEILSPADVITDPPVVVVATTSTGISKLDIGLYAYDYLIPEDANFGTWEDHWTSTIDTAPIDVIFNFIVIEAQLPVTAIAAGTIDGTLSQSAESNVLMLLKLLRARLGSGGLRRKRDQYGKYLLDINGNYITEDCHIFTTEELYIFLKASLAEFNSIPHFTTFTFDNTQFVNQFQHELTEGAYILALAKQGILEKGREFQINDDGVSYQPPQIADYIKGYLSDFMTKYQERLKFIKCNMKPSPLGIGTIYSWASGGAAPAFMRLRHLRARQII